MNPSSLAGIVLLALIIVAAFAYIFTAGSGTAKPDSAPAEIRNPQPSALPAALPQESPRAIAALPSPQAAAAISTPAPTPTPSPAPSPIPSPLPLTKPISSDALEGGAALKVFGMALADTGITPSPLVVTTKDFLQINIAAPNKKIDVESPDMKFYLVLEAGKPTTLTIDPLRAGIYTIRCKDFCPASGMISSHVIVQNP